MSHIILYNGLRADIEAITGLDGKPVFKYVRLYNSQYEHQERLKNDQSAFLFPACLIELKPSNFRDLLNGVQQYDLTVTLHIGFESYKDEDTDILTIKQNVFKAVHRKQYADFSMLLRRDERQNFDHPNTQIYEQDYFTTGKDFDADIRPKTQTGLISPAVTVNLITP